MPLFEKVKKILSTGSFDKRRSLAARKIYHDATGLEKQMIGQMFESQMVLTRNPEDAAWLQSIDSNYFSK